jgi:uncharacterized membrane protein YphA (DoxX/SURF4 family)
MSVASIAIAGTQTVVGLVGLLAGGAKVTHQEQQVDEFERYGYPQWFRIVTGLTEVFAGILLLAGLLWRPEASLVGGIVFSTAMVGAVVTHLRINDPLQKIGVPVVLLVLTVGLLAVQNAVVL